MTPAQLETLRISPVDRLEDVRGDWDRLAEGAGHPFATWEWVTSWWRWFGAGRPLYTFACRGPGGETLAILPMYVASTRPVRIARFLGYGDLYSPLCLPEHRELAAGALLQTLRRGHGGCRMVVAEKLPGGEGWDRMLGGTLVASHPEPILSIGGLGWEEFLASRSRSFRSSVRQQERRLERDHELSYRLADDPARLQDDLTTLFRLHGQRWGEQTTGVFDGDRGRMHREMAPEALERGWLRLWLLELDGEPVAAQYGWRFADREWFLQGGRDPRFAKQEVGKALLAHVIRTAFEDGLEEFRFLVGDEPYKLRWTTEDRPSETRLLASGVLGPVASLAIRRVGSLPTPLRNRVMRLTG
jgi:CelD/BcsL family acetyltransferase involved in cellulose biosynthesis